MESLQSLAHDLIEAGNEHFRIATQPARVLFWTADTAGACELVSSNWHEYTGQKMDDALGQGWLDAVHADDRVTVLETLCSGAAAHRGFYLRYRLLRADGEACWVLHDAAARFLPSGKFNGLVGTITDESDGHAGAQGAGRQA